MEKADVKLALEVVREEPLLIELDFKTLKLASLGAKGFEGALRRILFENGV